MPFSAICDASVAVRWLVDDPLSERALAARGRYELTAPRLLLSETANALRSYVRIGRLPLELAQRHLVSLPHQVEMRDEDEVLPLALGIAADMDHPVYDCVYVALALTSALPFITADARLARKFAGVSGVQFLTLQDWKP